MSARKTFAVPFRKMRFCSTANTMNIWGISYRKQALSADAVLRMPPPTNDAALANSCQMCLQIPALSIIFALLIICSINYTCTAKVSSVSLWNKPL